jgi:hypothetical protein
MKSRVLPLILGAAILASIPLFHNEASAQADTSTGTPELPVGKDVIVTLDPTSNSRKELTKEIQLYSGFSNHDTVEGKLIHINSEWVVLKAQAGVDENWIPRDKVLMLHANN